MNKLFFNWIKSIRPENKKLESQRLSLTIFKIQFYKSKLKQFPDEKIYKLKLQILKLIKKYIMESIRNEN